MSVNGITAVGDAYLFINKQNDYTSKVATDEIAEEAPVAVESGVVYEPSSPSKLLVANKEVVARLKASTDEQMLRLQELVSKLISKQGATYTDANDMWNALREQKVQVTPEVKAQAEADIAEDGYWGVKQTSDRIVDFAMALTGGDATKIDSMVDAFKKGYAQAEKTWGGKLPEISKKTYDAVIEKFDAIKASSETTTN